MLSQSFARFGCCVLLVASVACGDSTGPKAIEGIYALRTIGGNPLPAVIEQNRTEKNEITAGSITLGAGTTFTIKLSLRTTAGSRVDMLSGESTGTWTRSGSTVTMNATDGEVTAAVVSGATLTVNVDDGGGGTVTWVFRR